MIVLLALAGFLAFGASDALAQTLDLGEAVRTALGIHPMLQSATALEADAAAGLGEVRASRLPSATTEASLVRFQEPMIVAPLHAFDPTSPPSFDPTLIQSRTTVGYTLFDGGRRGGQIDRADGLANAAAAAVVASRAQVIEAVTSAFLEVLTLRGVADADERRVTALERERERILRLRAEGRAARRDELRVEAELARVEAARVATAARMTAAVRHLARLVGRPPAAIEAAGLTEVAIRQSAVPAIPGGENPEVVGARQRAAAERAGVRAARAAWLPTVRLQGAYLTFAGGGGRLAGEWQSGVAVSYPLFTGGARSRAIARAEAREARSAADARAVEWRVANERDRAEAAWHEHEGRIAALTAAVAHLTEIARIEQLTLREGTGVETDYLRAEADLATARADLVRASHAAIAARVALARVDGVLSPEWIADNVERQP